MSGVFKGVKKVFKGVVSIVKKIWKPILIAVAIYFGGWALGLWGAAGGAAGAGATGTAGAIAGETIMDAGVAGWLGGGAASGGAVATGLGATAPAAIGTEIAAPAASEFGTAIAPAAAPSSVATAQGAGSVIAEGGTTEFLQSLGMSGGPDVFAPELTGSEMASLGPAGTDASVLTTQQAQSTAIASGQPASGVANTTVQSVANPASQTKATDWVLGSQPTTTAANVPNSPVATGKVPEPEAGVSKLGGLLTELKGWAKTPMGTYTLGTFLTNLSTANAQEEAIKAARPKQYYGMAPNGRMATVQPISVAPAKQAAAPAVVTAQPQGLLDPLKYYMKQSGMPVNPYTITPGGLLSEENLA